MFGGEMQIERAAELERNWQARRDPPCKHPSYENEYYLGCVTGPVCTNCGEYLVPLLMETYCLTNPPRFFD